MSQTQPIRKGPSPWALLLGAFLVLPLVEIYLLVQVGQVIGAGWTIVLLVLDSVVGVALVRREGLRAWRNLQHTLAAGQVPSVGLADAALILIGATLLVTPGFLTDAIGLFCVLPFTRPLLRGVLARRLVVRATQVPFGGGRSGGSPRREPTPGHPAGPPSKPGRPKNDPERVVPGVVVESHDDTGASDEL